MNGNGINFFGWLREGVKQSVLLGVSDAIETIGTPEDASNMHPNVAALLKSSSSPANRLEGTPPRLQGTASQSKKRLGRSLKDIAPTESP